MLRPKSTTHIKPTRVYEQKIEEIAAKRYVAVKNVLQSFKYNNPNLKYSTNYTISNDSHILIHVSNIEELSTLELTEKLERQGLLGSDFQYKTSTSGLVTGILKVPIYQVESRDDVNSGGCCSAICGSPIFWILLLSIVMVGAWSLTSYDSKQRFIENYVWGIGGAQEYTSMPEETETIHKQFQQQHKDDINVDNENYNNNNCLDGSCQGLKK